MVHAIMGSAMTIPMHVVDLSHTIDEKTVVWDGSCGFSSVLTGDYQTGGFRGHLFTMRSCLGTHIDSPAHCFEGAVDCANLSLVNGIVPAYVIDVSLKAHADYAISLCDVEEFELRYGKINPGTIVFFSTGWAKKWGTLAYRNVDDNGTPHFPFIKEEVIELLLKREITAIGVDTVSPDSFYLPPVAHKLLLSSNKYIIENVANLDKMPPVGALVIALPLKISGAAESPVRLVGILNKNL